MQQSKNTPFRVSRNGPAAGSKHYRTGDIEPIDLIISQKLDFLEGDVVKYVCRYKHKGTPMQDLLKIKQYVDWMIERQQYEDSTNSTVRES